MRGTRVHRLSHLQGATDGWWWWWWWWRWCHLQHSVQVKLSKNPHSQWVMTSPGQLECKRVSFPPPLYQEPINESVISRDCLIWWPTRFVVIYFCIYVPVFYKSLLSQTISKHVKTSGTSQCKHIFPLTPIPVTQKKRHRQKTGSAKSHWMFIFTVCSQYIFLKISTEGINQGSAAKNQKTQKKLIQYY